MENKGDEGREFSDDPKQESGSKPLNVFGRSRSRRLFYWGLIVYPSSSLVVAGLFLFANNEPYPSQFHPPQLCLLLDAVYSAAAAGLLFQRYHGASSSGLSMTRFVSIAFLFIGIAGCSPSFFKLESVYIFAFILRCDMYHPDSFGPWQVNKNYKHVLP